MENGNSTILEGLNSEQKAAVSCVDGPVLIVAGAGSGKTRVLTSRIAYILEKGCDPSRILALTFTKKAASEMKERIALMVGERKARKLFMGIFKQQAGYIVNNEDLQHQRNASDDPDKYFRYGFDDLKTTHRAERYRQTKRCAAKQRHRKD